MLFKELMKIQRADNRTENKRKIIYCMYDNEEQNVRSDMPDGKFTLKELGLDPTGYYLVSPVNKPISVGRLMDILHWYNNDKGNNILNYSGCDNHKIVELLKKELGIDDVEEVQGDKLEKVSALLRMIRKCKAEEQMEIYEICKQAIIRHEENNTNDIMALVDEALDKNILLPKNE